MALTAAIEAVILMATEAVILMAIEAVILMAIEAALEAAFEATVVMAVVMAVRSRRPSYLLDLADGEQVRRRLFGKGSHAERACRDDARDQQKLDGPAQAEEAGGCAEEGGGSAPGLGKGRR